MSWQLKLKLCSTFWACKSLAGRRLRSGMSYRKWSRIRLPARSSGWRCCWASLNLRWWQQGGEGGYTYSAVLGGATLVFSAAVLSSGTETPHTAGTDFYFMTLNSCKSHRFSFLSKTSLVGRMVVLQCYEFNFMFPLLPHVDVPLGKELNPKSPTELCIGAQTWTVGWLTKLLGVVGIIKALHNF